MHKMFEKLKSLGAGDFQHLNGTLIEHLQGTVSILESWSASENLKAAGLFHAAYGTAAFDANMVSLSQRQEIAALIGKEAEALVYLYCSCDRDYVFPQFHKSKPIHFKDRFNQDSFILDRGLLEPFCELTVANELELVFSSDKFKISYGQALRKLFEGMKPYLSPQARAAYQSELTEYP